MKTIISLVCAVSLIASLGIEAQQTPSTSQLTLTQAQPASAPTTPCVKTAAAPPRKQSWIEKKAKALACQKNKNFCDIPASDSEITGGTPESKPCPVTPASPPKAQQVPPAATPVPAVPAVSSKPTFVCPPKTTLIPGTPYCLTGDHSTVDAIPLPASLAVPTGTPSPAPSPQPTNKPTKDGSGPCGCAPRLWKEPYCPHSMTTFSTDRFSICRTLTTSMAGLPAKESPSLALPDRARAVAAEGSLRWASLKHQRAEGLSLQPRRRKPRTGFAMPGSHLQNSPAPVSRLAVDAY